MFVIKPPILSIEIAEFGREFEREREEKTETTKNLSLLLDTAVIPHIYIDGWVTAVKSYNCGKSITTIKCKPNRLTNI